MILSEATLLPPPLCPSRQEPVSKSMPASMTSPAPARQNRRKRANDGETPLRLQQQEIGLVGYWLAAVSVLQKVSTTRYARVCSTRGQTPLRKWPCRAGAEGAGGHTTEKGKKKEARDGFLRCATMENAQGTSGEHNIIHPPCPKCERASAPVKRVCTVNIHVRAAAVCANFAFSRRPLSAKKVRVVVAERTRRGNLRSSEIATCPANA